METTTTKKITRISGPDFIERLGADGWTYIRTVVDVAREPILILSKDSKVMAANDAFYQMFQTTRDNTEGKIVYELGNGQWNISALKQLLEDILPKNTFFKGFEVTHEFPGIGKKIMILNAREIHCADNPILEPCPPIIMLAIEDVTEMMDVADMLARHTNQFQTEMAERTANLEVHIKELKKELDNIKNK